MRITNPMVTRNYTKGLHSNRGMLDQYATQIYSGRKFNKMSEDTAAGVRAMQVRRNISRIDGYIDNVKSSQSYLKAAETTMIQVSSLSHSFSEKFIQGMNGTEGDDERDIIAAELEKLQEELLSLANGRFSDRYMFGGTNTVTQPFTTDDTGALYYNGVDVTQLQPGDPLLKDAAYVDLGLGVNFNNNQDSTQVDPNTAYKYTLVGADMLGIGSDNLYLVMGEMVDCLKSSSFDIKEAGNLLTRFQESSANVNIAVTKLGSDDQYLTFTLDRLETEKINLQERQSQLEAADPAEAIMNFKVQEYIYNAALQMGSRILQPNLFSFIN